MTTKRSESEILTRKKYLLFNNKIKWYFTLYNHKVNLILLLSKYWSYEAIIKLQSKYTISELFEWKEKFVLKKTSK